jgi:hypothetical protein
MCSFFQRVTITVRTHGRSRTDTPFGLVFETSGYTIRLRGHIFPDDNKYQDKKNEEWSAPLLDFELFHYVRSEGFEPPALSV